MNLNDANRIHDAAPDDTALFMFSLLTSENKEKVIQFIADLKEKQ